MFNKFKSIVLIILVVFSSVVLAEVEFDPLRVPKPQVVQPRKGVRIKRKKPELPPEGSKVVDRLCRAEIDPSGWVLLSFPYELGRKSFPSGWSLPNEYLEEIENRLANNGADQLFKITAETAIYDDGLYFLVTRLAVVKQKIPVTQPATQPQASTQPARSQDVLKEMLGEKSPEPVIILTQSERAVVVDDASVAPKGISQDIILPVRGAFIVDRLVTVESTGTGKWKQAVFIGDNTLREPPVSLMPCKQLEKVERFADNTKLRITGKIYIYKGKRFMKLNKALKERELGQF